MSNLKATKRYPKGLSEGLAFAVLTLWATGAFAANFANIAENLTTQLGSIPDFIALVCYIMGLTFMGQGLVKLKEHAEAPQNVKIINGLGRLIAGAAALSLPLITGWAHSTLGLGDDNPVFSSINVIAK